MCFWILLWLTSKFQFTVWPIHCHRCLLYWLWWYLWFSGCCGCCGYCSCCGCWHCCWPSCPGGCGGPPPWSIFMSSLFFFCYVCLSYIYIPFFIYYVTEWYLILLLAVKFFSLIQLTLLFHTFLCLLIVYNPLLSEFLMCAWNRQSSPLLDLLINL